MDFINNEIHRSGSENRCQGGGKNNYYLNKTMKKICKNIFALILSVTLVAAFAAPVRALDFWGGEEANVKANIGFEGPDKDPRVIIASVINVLLSLLGIIAVILIIYAGFLWMTAGGDKEKVKKATDIMKNSAIGLIIILAAWGISNFILTSANSVVTD